MGEPQTRKSAPLVTRKPGQPTTVVTAGGVPFGGKNIVLIGGPCAVESGTQILAAAQHVSQTGGKMLRGGAWKPRTSPYDFQGLGAEGLTHLVAARKNTGLPFVTEVMDPRDVELVAASADLLQIGSRSVQNFPLLKEVGLSGKPVLLKRGMMTTVDEWLNAAEYIVAAGNPQVIFCERGIRTFETVLRNTLDVGSMAVLKEMTHLPVIVDPSHAETHPAPAEALSDGGQSLNPAQFAELVAGCQAVARAVGRDF